VTYHHHWCCCTTVYLRKGAFVKRAVWEGRRSQSTMSKLAMTDREWKSRSVRDCRGQSLEQEKVEQP